MKLIASFILEKKLRPLLLRDSVIGGALDWQNIEYRCDLDSGSPILSRIVELSHKVDGLSFQIREEFSKKEMAAASLFSLYPTTEDVVMTTDDQMINEKYIKSLDHLRRIPDTGIRIIDQIYLSFIKAKYSANSIFHMFDSIFVNRNVRDILEKENITGLRFGPIIQSKTNQPYEHMHLLVPTNVLPPCENDQSVRVHTVHGDINSYVIQGCVSYSPESTLSAMDFNCMCESCTSWDVGLPIVSRRLRDIFKQYEIKGARFKPVLDTSTSLYAEYHVLHKHLIEKIQNNPMNKL